MTAFWLILVALTAAAVLLLVLPLLRPGRRAQTSLADANVSIYRDQFAELERDLAGGTLTQDQYTQARAELERRMLDDVDSAAPAKPKASRSGLVAAVIVGVAVPMSAGLLYMHLGNPQALSTPKHPPLDASSVTIEQFQEMTSKLAAKLEKNPNDPVGWTMLGRAYKALERYPDAIKAFEQAEKLDPNNPDVLVEHAETIGLAHRGNLQGEPMRLLEHALKIAPNNEKALTLMGAAAFGQNDYATAIRYWERLNATVPPDSELGRALASGIAEARARMGGKAPAPKTAQKAPAAAKTVSGVVQLSGALAGKAAPEDNVFVFARAAEGPRMPLAVLRRQVKDLPLTFKLDDSMAMTPGLELSSFPRVIVGARISKSGRPTSSPGDLEGVSQPVAPGATGITVLIDKQVQ
ncbi:MAG TPA: c-type cytochrome biogenesis protein CcmI [Burkholderiales bacterium]|nr:c-type cytochrome biogenesis protein CcmI [Burkholderiales bacterium]